MAPYKEPSYIGIRSTACRYPGVSGSDGLWERLHNKAPMPALSRLAEPTSSYAEYGVPPIYRNSINEAQLIAFELAREALSKGDVNGDEIDREFTDVIFCTGFGMNRAYDNFCRLYAQGIINDLGSVIEGLDKKDFVDSLKADLHQRFSPTSHDKVGEMASTIPARIASYFKLRGSAVAMESGDGVGAHALAVAVDALRNGTASAVLLISVQKVESDLMAEILEKKGVDVAVRSGSEFLQPCGGLAEGGCAVLLTTSARNDDGALAYIRDFELRAPASEDLKGHLQRRVTTDTRYIDIVASQEKTSNELVRHVRQASRRCTVGSAQVTLGYTYASSVFTSLLSAVETVRRRAVAAAGASVIESPAFSESGSHPEASSFHALVAGQALSGELFSIGLSSRPELVEDGELDADPLAIVAMGAHFGKARGLAQYWGALCDDKGSIAPIDHAQPVYSGLHDKSPGLVDRYYNHQASPLAESSSNNDVDPFVSKRPADVAMTAAREASGGCSLQGRVMAVTATNLTSTLEKRAACRHFFAELETAIEERMDQIHIEEPARSEMLEKLAGWKARCEDSVNWDSLAASAIGHRVSELFQTSCISLALESACAGSFAALQIAANALSAGRADAAILTGVDLPVNPVDLCLCSAQRMLAPDVIATFCEDAPGFTPGDGGGVIVLEKRRDAVECSRDIHALITAVGSCTESKSVIAPNASGQIKSMQRAFGRMSAEQPRVSYIETHGTGTKVGDLVELTSIREAYGQSSRDPILLGALKTRFGHTFSASGCASLIKIALTIKHRLFPKNIIRGNLSGDVNELSDRFSVLDHEVPFESMEEEPVHFSANAFGTGGVNYHVLIEAPKP